MRAREFIFEESTMALVKKVADANGIANPNLIKVGQKINLPNGTTYTVAAGDTLSAIVNGQFKGTAPDAANARPGLAPKTAASSWQDSSGTPIKSGDGQPVAGPSAGTDSIKPVNARVTSPFGPRREPKPGASANHLGVDLGSAVGTPVKAPISGRVTQAVMSTNACGGTIAISDGTVQHRFCHCSKINVQVGQDVEQGAVVGLTGGGPGTPGAGVSTGPHLHWEKKILATNTLTNPLA
jgi:murein DD-endopeptidase MepM/ murein hydrolase activator NlpD